MEQRKLIPTYGDLWACGHQHNAARSNFIPDKTVNIDLISLRHDKKKTEIHFAFGPMQRDRLTNSLRNRKCVFVVVAIAGHRRQRWEVSCARRKNLCRTYAGCRRTNANSTRANTLSLLILWHVLLSISHWTCSECVAMNTSERESHNIDDSWTHRQPQQLFM